MDSEKNAPYIAGQNATLKLMALALLSGVGSGTMHILYHHMGGNLVTAQGTPSHFWKKPRFQQNPG